ncbi:alpha/beta hydrolase family protein [Streptomyces sp. NBC_00536]|uniref:alpha/beta hydrolase n=1 Tax=Streptomyces sp. NBC_00536 TaxID=2975769 RepID=UPI002E7FC14B|nr:alpha/beta hydrolase [Streptomyces sp. NBC_00536]WUC80472.1 alpha/beta hydrolase family protein [Streptomyces sp. NBC_00536]
MTLTWQQLRDLKTNEFTEAATGWADASNRANAARNRISMEMLKSLETQKGESATAAHDRLRRLDRNFDYVHTECGLVRTTLGALAQELSTQQTRLKAALDDASTHGFTLHADGSVEYPPAGENFLTKQPVPGSSVQGVDRRLFLRELPMHPQAQPPMGADANPHHAAAQEIAGRIRTAVLAAQEADARFTQALNRLVAADSLDITDATWADAAADAALVRKEAGHYLHDTIPLDRSPADRHAWWQGLTDDQRAEYLAVYPDVIGNLDGIPSETRDRANRDNLEMLIGKLSGQGDEKSRNQLEGLRSINDQLWNQAPTNPPMYLLGIGDQNNGRAIVSFGNPDTSKNVSAYVPGLGTALDGSFARNDIQRARDTALDARFYDPSSASIVWLGYDAPQLPADNLLDNLAVTTMDDARRGAGDYNKFMAGISSTNQNADPHITAIGHSYGSLTVGQAAQQPGGIPGADDIILVGSPGTGAQNADQLGVGRDHVYVGAAQNDLVTKAPNTAETAGLLGGGAAGAVAGGVVGSALGPLGTVGGAVIGGGVGAFHGYVVGDALSDPSQIHFGTDPANREFGAHRFRVDDGPTPIIGGDGPIEAHSNYFNPKKDKDSAGNIALIIAGRPQDISTQEPR